MSALGLASLGVQCQDRALGMATLGVFCSETPGGAEGFDYESDYEIIRRNRLRQLRREDDELLGVITAFLRMLGG